MGDLRHFSPKSKSIVSFVNGKNYCNNVECHSMMVYQTIQYCCVFKTASYSELDMALNKSLL